MLRKRISITVVLLTLGACVGESLGAAAWAGGFTDPYGSTVCGSDSCAVVAGTGAGPVLTGLLPGTPGGSARGGGSGSGTGSGGASNCGYAPDGSPTTGPNGQKEQWFLFECDGQVTGTFFGPGPQLLPVGNTAGQGGAAQVSPAVLAAQALRELHLPTPAVKTSPDAAFEQLVHVPVWLWVTAASWKPVSATASVPGASVTAVATPRRTVWRMGDGSTVTCSGPGSAYASGDDPSSSSPTCGHTFQTSSTDQPGAAFTATVTENWSVTWSGAGASGTFPDLNTTAQFQMRVGESQALVTGVHAR